MTWALDSANADASDEPTIPVRPVRSWGDMPTGRLAPVSVPRTSPGRGPSRGLRAAVAIAAAAVGLAGGGVLAAQAGVLRLKLPGPAAMAATQGHSNGLLESTGSTADGAGYRVLTGGTFTVLIRDESRPCWMSVTADGRVVYAGVARAGQTVRAHGRSSVVIEIGAGGAKVTVNAAHHSQSLQPAHAPYRLTFTR